MPSNLSLNTIFSVFRLACTLYAAVTFTHLSFRFVDSGIRVLQASSSSSSSLLSLPSTSASSSSSSRDLIAFTKGVGLGFRFRFFFCTIPGVYGTVLWQAMGTGIESEMGRSVSRVFPFALCKILIAGFGRLGCIARKGERQVEWMAWSSTRSGCPLRDWIGCSAGYVEASALLGLGLVPVGIIQAFDELLRSGRVQIRLAPLPVPLAFDHASSAGGMLWPVRTMALSVSSFRWAMWRLCSPIDDPLLTSYTMSLHHPA